MANSSITLVNLDFDTFKDSLKEFLKAQPVYKDYNFEGSNLNVLLDLLAYNTFQNAFYLNMIASESFLDSSQTREAAISHAKELNYVPRSVRSARANVNISFSANTSVVNIPAGTSFTTTIGTELFTFVTDTSSVHFSSDSGASKTFNVRDLEIYEGHVVTDRFVTDYSDPTQRFLLSDPGIDTRSISVMVYEDAGSTTRVYTQSSTLLGLGADSLSYFLQAAENDKYEIIFGDGIIGRRPKDASVVEISYRASRGSAGNGAFKFSLDEDFTSGKFTTTPQVTVNEIASGGAEQESTESIKYYAPRHFQLQERATNAPDYEVLLKQRFPEINAVSAYGGDELHPPEYGKVFISVDISDVSGLPDSKIREYTNFLKPRSSLTIEPVFVVPEYLYFSVDSIVKYNVNVTTLKPDQIKAMALNKVIAYVNNYLDDFKSTFRYSRFVHELDCACMLSVVSNETKVRIYKKISPVLGAAQNMTVNFDIPLATDVAKIGTQYDSDDTVVVYSSEYILSGERLRIHDDGAGTLRAVKLVGNKYVVVIPNLGTVDYANGIVRLINFKADAYLGSSFRIYGKTAEADFSSTKNVILTLDTNEVNITVVPVRDLTESLSQSTQRA